VDYYLSARTERLLTLVATFTEGPPRFPVAENAMQGGDQVITDLFELRIIPSQLILRLGKGDSLLSARLLPVFFTNCLRATGGFMHLELMVRFDGEFGLGSFGELRCYFVDESYLVRGEPVLLSDLIDWKKAASLVPAGSLTKSESYDNRKLGPQSASLETGSD
jgi:hypothetical protein